MASINISNDEDRKSCDKVGRIYNAILNDIKEKAIFEESLIVLIKRDPKEVFFEKLLKKEGDVNYGISKNSRRVPNLLCTALYKNYEFFVLLLEYGADFTYQNEEGQTVVHEAINRQVYGHISFHKYKNIENYIDAVLNAHVKFNNPSNPSDKNGITHFHAACMTDNLAATDIFLKNGVDVNQAINVDSPIFPGYTPLHLAVKYACSNVVKTLLINGADMHIKNTAGLSPLQLTVKKKTDIWDIDVDKDNFERTLDVSAFLINDDVISIIDADDFGISALHVASVHHDESLVRRILEKIENINQPVNFDSPVCPGYTALHFAAFSKVEIFQLLLDKGANIEVKNAKDLTPLDLCAQNYTVKDIYSILLSKKEWANIVLSDKVTKLINVISAMENVDELTSLLNGIGCFADTFIPFDSPIWPGYTLLHLAVVFTSARPVIDFVQFVMKCDVEKIELCLERRADVTIKDANGSTALHLAFHTHKRSVIKCMLDRHDKPDNPADENNLSHFHIACAVGHQKAVEHFLSIGVDVNIPVLSTLKCQLLERSYKDSTEFFVYAGSTALHISVASADNEITKTLLKHGADVNAQDVNGLTPVHRLLFVKKFDRHNYVSNSLLTAENLKNIETSYGLNHLHVACLCENEHAANELLKLGADINAPVNYNHEVNVNNYNKVFVDSHEYFRRLFFSETFLSVYDGYTPLHFACSVKFFRTSKALTLIEKNANVFTRNAKGIFPLETLIQNIGDYDTYSKLINKDTAIKTYMEEEYGITELHIVCFLVKVELVRNLIEGGANVNAKVYPSSPRWQGYTPLHCAVAGQYGKYYKDNHVDDWKEIVQLLMKHGANLLSVNDNNDTPFHIIKYLYGNPRRVHEELPTVYPILTMLFDNLKRFDVNPVNNDGLSLFHVACITANAAIIKKFLKHNVDVNQVTGYFSEVCPGSTPLHLLIQHYRNLNYYSSIFGFSDKNFVRIVDMLLEKDANVNAVDAFGNTPLHEAIVELTGGLRLVLIRKLISHGANVHIENNRCDTSFKFLLRRGDATWEEIQHFLKAGSNFNTYNSATQEGYMATFLRYHRGIKSSRTFMNNQLLSRIINNPKVIESSESGRTLLHNVVSIGPISMDVKKPLVYRSGPPLVKL